jgi:DNA-binding CsgD family transcriptional regulator
MGTTQELAAGDAALRAGAWQQARSRFEAVLATASAGAMPDPATAGLAYEGLAQAAWWLDDADMCIGARERAYRRFRDAGDGRGCARAATSLAWDALLFGHGPAVARGWLGRARELLADLDESAEHGWLAVREAEHALFLDHDPAAASEAADRAQALGRRLAVTDLHVAGLALSGLARVSTGAVTEGMARLDTAVAAATAGDVADLMWTGKVCCWLIAACRGTQDVDRAVEWCRRVEALCLERDLQPLLTVCRIEYATLQVARGAWAGAERELTAALDRLTTSQRAARHDAVARLGELRRRQGRDDEAEVLFAQAEFHPVAVVGRALLLLAQGEAGPAWSRIDGLLRARPREDRLDRATVLLPAVRAARAAGEDAAAQECAKELRVTATTTGTPVLLGLAAAADATLAAGPAAVRHWREAVRLFRDAGTAFDEADARVELAAALLANDDLDGAGEQIESALRTFTQLSAGTGLARACTVDADLHRARGTRARASHSPLSARETQVLALVAAGMSNARIAQELLISEHTVHRHVANILAKLAVPTRAAAAAYAVHAGVLPP